jgi:hypothetical protein
MHGTTNTSRKNHSGYMTLISMLVVGAIGTAITVSLLSLGIGAAKTSFAIEQSNQAKAFANQCAEEVLQRIREESLQFDTGTLLFDSGSCSFAVTYQGTEKRTVKASGFVGTVVRKVEIVVEAFNPTLLITSWQEVADF